MIDFSVYFKNNVVPDVFICNRNMNQKEWAKHEKPGPNSRNDIIMLQECFGPEWIYAIVIILTVPLWQGQIFKIDDLF